MSDPKREVTAAIERAQAALDQALTELDQIPAADTKTIGLAAHALNNFLTVSGAVVELLQGALKGHPQPNVLVWLEALGHSTNLMIHTVSRLVNTSTGIEARLRINDVDLSIIVQRACAYYQQKATHKGVRLSFDVPSDAPVVRTDRVVVAAILDNLLSNALKYSPPGKQIWVRVDRQDDGAVCSVQDEGPGLTAEEQARLFQPGARVGPVPSAGEPSSGYGLALARQFTEMLSGRIWCTSVKGEGATFAFWLPLRAGLASPGS